MIDSFAYRSTDTGLHLSEAFALLRAAQTEADEAALLESTRHPDEPKRNGLAR
jgi:hypothetical protein